MKEINYNYIDKESLINKFDSNIITIKEFLNIIDNLINNNIKLANELFDYINLNYHLNNYQIEINYLKNKLTEKNIYNSLSEEKQKLYNYYITEGSFAYKNYNFNAALNYYKEGKKATNHPIFDYYIGKIYFKQRNLTPSYEYLSKYEKNGGEKEIHTLLYIWANDKHIKRSKILEMDEKAKKLINFYDSLKNWKLPDFKKKLNPPIKEKDIDYSKYKGYRKISMSENDFTPKNLTINEFDNYPIKDQLIFIRQLYNNGNITLATNLLKQLEKSNLNSSSRQQLTSIKKLMRIKK